MAKVATNTLTLVTPPPPPTPPPVLEGTVTLVLTADEASGLRALMGYGSGLRTLNALGITQVYKALERAFEDRNVVSTAPKFDSIAHAEAADA